MERNKGAFYSVDELKDLIAFCKERYITLIPEIDLPGHSAAFKRAFKCGMQSYTGLSIVKNIIKEVCNTYNVPYLHIGGDEVKITNKQFLPTVIQYVHELGKQTIGWSPGGEMDNSTIHQLWMTGGATNPQVKYIDSRNLYINHMDPLESVISIYNRKIGDQDSGTNNLLGGELCLWPDRNVIKQDDILTMNPVYPAILTFGERSWKGGGTNGWHTNIIADNGEFANFENRLIDQQRQYFANMPFAYVRQSEIKWHLYGPYPNKGILTTAFAPEHERFHPQKQKDQVVTGGTIILRHFWFPEVKSILDSPKNSSTYYAMMRVWSSRDTTALMWIGFYNISRSVPTSTPVADAWDDRNSEIWINKQLISAPLWARSGQIGDIEKPLIDEDYEYRTPTKALLHEGWNEVLVKLPIGSFKSSTIQKPVKWMFTAVFVKPLGQNFIADDALIYNNDSMPLVK
jgi:hexosaminidase